MQAYMYYRLKLYEDSMNPINGSCKMPRKDITPYAVCQPQRLSVNGSEPLEKTVTSRCLDAGSCSSRRREDSRRARSCLVKAGPYQQQGALTTYAQLCAASITGSHRHRSGHHGVSRRLLYVLPTGGGKGSCLLDDRSRCRRQE